MALFGVFARPDHPVGWGYPVPGDLVGLGGGGRAHGYVILYVRCQDDDQLQAVAAMLRDRDFTGLPAGGYNDGALGQWFGGRFDYVTLIDGDIDIYGDQPAYSGGRFRCRGDNRMVAVFDADEVLAS